MPSAIAEQIRTSLNAFRDAPPPASIEESRARLEALVSQTPPLQTVKWRSWMLTAFTANGSARRARRLIASCCICMAARIRSGHTTRIVI